MLMMVMVLTMAGCGGSSEEAPAEEPAETEQAEEPAAEPIGIHHAEIVIKVFGTVKGEFSANGLNNDISHKKGVISMARAQDPDSASSQFFIVQEDSEFLDGQYAAFGHVTEGMEFVDIIAKEAKPIDDNGTIPKEEQPVIETIKIID